MSFILAASAANSAATGAAPGRQGGGGSGDDSRGPNPDEVLVYWLDIALLCAMGAFFLAFLPRAIGRFSNSFEWKRRLILRRGRNPEPMVQRILPHERLYRAETSTTFGDDDETSYQSHTLANHTGNMGAWSGKELASMPPAVSSPPIHVSSLTSIFHPFSALFSYSVAPGRSVGKITLMAIYLGVVLFITFFKKGNPLEDSNRVGFIAVSQIPVAVALGTKNNVIGMLLGMGYERLNYLHRWVGIVTFGTSVVHALGYIYKYAIAGQLGPKLNRPFIINGLIGLGGVSVLYFASLSVIRKRFYTFFLYAHIAGNVLFFVGVYLHESVCRKYVLLAVGIYGIDHVLRVIKTRISTAHVTVVKELGLTRIELPHVGAGWRAGQHVRLRILSSELGFLGWTIAHPFTVASASDSTSGRGLVLLCKKAGGWTGRLYSAATRANAFAIEKGNGVSQVRYMKVILEGPYGGVGNMVMSSYSSVLLVVGGSGVTFSLSQTEELVQDIIAGRSAVKFIEIVWITQDKNSLAALLSTFSALLSSVLQVQGVIMRISVHYTRADQSSGPTYIDIAKYTNQSSGLDAHLARLAPNLTLHRGRPMLPHIVSSIAQVTSSIQSAKGLAVGVCGPAGLAGEVGRAVRGIEGRMRAACGGVDLHEEVFGW